MCFPQERECSPRSELDYCSHFDAGQEMVGKIQCGLCPGRRLVFEGKVNTDAKQRFGIALVTGDNKYESDIKHIQVYVDNRIDYNGKCYTTIVNRKAGVK